MSFFRNTSFTQKQLLLGLGLAGVSVLVLAVSLHYSRSHMIGSKDYFEIEASMDLVADILPPPAYLIELFLVSKELVEVERRDEQQQLIERAGNLRDDYLRRHEHWIQNLPEDHAKQKFRETGIHGLELIRIMDGEFLPLIVEGRTEEAHTVLSQKLTPIFRKHRRTIEETVPLTLAKRKEIADRAKQDTLYFYKFTTSFAVFLIGLAFCVYWRMGQSVRNRILALQVSAASIASGDLCAGSIDDGNDEIGLTSRSYHAVKSSLSMLTKEIQQLVNAAQQGNLSVRVDARKYQGVFGELVDGLNKTLAAISAPIDEAVDVLSLVAKRNLTGAVEGDYAGQFKRVKTSLNEALHGLNELLYQVSVGADLVEVASNDIAESSRSLAARASAQATTLAAITTSMDQIASSTIQSARINRVGCDLANESKSMVDEGSLVMQSMAEAISKIKGSAEASALIVKTIDDIAFQTGILALNAAVEAARAGESGQGFAVVATEFRNLAIQSADAAKLTATMIEDSVRNADNGVCITVKMGEILSDIRERSNRVNELMSGIAISSQEQSRKIEHVNHALTELEELTKQTAEVSVNSLNSAEELRSEACSLNENLSAFRLVELPPQDRSLSPSLCVCK